MTHRLPVLLLVLLVACACDLTAQNPVASEREPLSRCEWCGAPDAPDNLDWTVTIAPADEPGERLVLEGTVTESDGITPVAGVVLYAYHTDASGVYPDRAEQTGNGRRHGRLRGWLETGDDGRYRIDTVRPGTYPTRSEPAHVHFTVLPPGGEEYWLPAVVFAGDPLLTDEEPGSIVSLEQGADGVWRGTWNLAIRE
jgi:protocatechuate 3,4-dioxygenase beta subunit